MPAERSRPNFSKKRHLPPPHLRFSKPATMPAERSRKYVSPPPPPPTMTPPPSSSQPTSAMAPYPARTPTPTHSHLSSPPPTVKAAASRRRSGRIDTDSNSTSSDNESHPSVEQLHALLADVREERNAAKTAAAHYRFQLELVNFDTSECIKRMEVELDMAAREIDVLRRTPAATPVTSVDAEFLEWKNRCLMLEMENESLRARLSDAKALLVERDDQNAQQTEKLKKRIRDNRMRVNQLRNSGALFGEILPTFETPSRPDNKTYTSPSKGRKEDLFGELLLADQVLRRREAASTPSTPHPSRQRATAHTRGQHSLTSLPSTPYRAAPRPRHTQYPKPGPFLAVDKQAVASSARRRESRDSTISASDLDVNDGEERVPDSEGTQDSDEAEDDTQVGASQASQEAASMLRRSATFRKPEAQVPNFRKPYSGDVGSTKISTPNDATGGQMYGYQITKSGAAGQPELIKRRFYDGGELGSSPRAKKRGRTGGLASATAGENVGLGLGLEVDGWMGGK